MKQYLLAVHSVDGDPIPSQEEMEPVYEAVNKFNADLQDSGAWVFAGGLYSLRQRRWFVHKVGRS